MLIFRNFCRIDYDAIWFINRIKTIRFKGILAYSTISQLGMMMSMVGIGGGYAQHPSDSLTEFYVLVLFAGLFHLMNHAILNVLCLWV